MGCWNYWGWVGRISPVCQTDASAGLLENGLEVEKPGARRWNDMSLGMTDDRNFSERRIWSQGSQRWGFGKKNKNVQRGKVQAPKLRNSRNYDQYVYSAFTSSGFHTTSWYPPHHRPKADTAQNLPYADDKRLRKANTGSHSMWTVGLDRNWGPDARPWSRLAMLEYTA